MRRRRLTLAAGSAAALAAVGMAVMAPSEATPAGPRCPANTLMIQSQADYDESRLNDGFDSPEAAAEYLRATLYPGMPKGQFKRTLVQPDRVTLGSDVAEATVRELDVRRRVALDGPVVVEESGTEWAVESFSICQVDAQRWAR